MFEAVASPLFLPLSLLHTHTISLFPLFPTVTLSCTRTNFLTRTFHLTFYLPLSNTHTLTHAHTYTHSSCLTPKYKHLSFLTHPNLFSPILTSPVPPLHYTTPHRRFSCADNVWRKGPCPRLQTKSVHTCLAVRWCGSVWWVALGANIRLS